MTAMSVRMLQMYHCSDELRPVGLLHVFFPRWIYWTVTLLFVLTLMSAGVTFLAGASFNVEGVTHLGDPVYLQVKGSQA
jgi:hypothetical protein